MSNTTPPVPRFEPLDDELIQKISGGGTCSADELQGIFDNLKGNYETLIDFTSYVIERVVGSGS